jgi:hypothetical protein
LRGWSRKSKIVGSLYYQRKDSFLEEWSDPKHTRKELELSDRFQATEILRLLLPSLSWKYKYYFIFHEKLKMPFLPKGNLHITHFNVLPFCHCVSSKKMTTWEIVFIAVEIQLLLFSILIVVSRYLSTYNKFTLIF